MDGVRYDCQREAKEQFPTMRATEHGAGTGVTAASGSVAAACEHLIETDARTLDDMRTLVRVPAPPFGEALRGEWLAERFDETGLVDVVTDAAGNVLARYPANGGAGTPVLIVAHLDTVFPADTPLHLVESNGRISAPGISDNARGLAGLLALARSLVAARVVTRNPIVFCGSVGEEGVGDLRGVKHLFREGSPWRSCAGFIALDGTGSRRIAHRAVGSRRLRVEVSGPGGHSWADRGAPNPIHALSAGVARLDVMRLPEAAVTSLGVGRMGGGTSVNAVPASAWLEIDLRSENRNALETLERRTLSLLERAVADANATASAQRRLRFEVAIIGDRPTGETAVTSPLVTGAVTATRSIGASPELVASSTDANVPIALGIPAIAIGAGGESGKAHTTDEWYANEGGPDGLRRALLTLLAAAGVD
jgi:acetylornithine deacetylase/succinyl-diaminopimelate desuccinylase-like protein